MRVTIRGSLLLRFFSALTFQAAACASIFLSSANATEGTQTKPITDVIGMYVFEGWPYKHPYSARTWTIDDWRNYAGGLRKLGYNAVLIWPMLEMMPDRLTPSDEESLMRHAKVINMLHREFRMNVILIVTPNTVANDKAASAAFDERHFYWSTESVDPANSASVKKMMETRGRLFSYLKAADAVAIIDSDPGGYPSSSNADFVRLLSLHRQMLDKLRPGIELDYWVHEGWHFWSDYLMNGTIAGDAERRTNQIDTLRLVKAQNLSPWGLANSLKQNIPYIENTGLSSLVLNFNYGAIEGEPQMPLTNFGDTAAYDGGADRGPRGVVGNAQTACVQLPNTFAFARGAEGKSLTESDYVEFADRLIRGQGRVVVEAWKALGGSDAPLMRSNGRKIRQLAQEKLELGDLRGLLFGSAARFLQDLSSQLELKAAYEDLLAAIAHKSEISPRLRGFIGRAEDWDNRHGYQNYWIWPGMPEALRQLHSDVLDRALDLNETSNAAFCEHESTRTAATSVASRRCLPGMELLQRQETFIPQLLAAMKRTVVENRTGH